MTTSLPAAAPATAGAASPCCTEFARISRRGLLTGAALAGTTTVLGSAVVTASAASVVPAPAVMVVLSLRGAADGMSLVVPHGDPVYYQARPRIAVPADTLLVKDELFGLHPELAPLLPLWNAGRLASVHATGLPAPNRSHFSAMEELEDADPGSAARVGWLNRLVGLDANRSPLQAFGLGGGVPPTSLVGPEDVITASDVASVEIPGDDPGDVGRPRLASLHRLWDGDTSTLGRAMRATFAAVDDFAAVRATSETPANGAVYPSGDLGDAMAQAARIVRGDVGVEVITVDHGSWDHHSGLGTLEWGGMQRNARELAEALAAFFTDLGALADKVTVVALSEFGRRVQENASYGLDHGFGGVMLLAGAGVVGGYHGQWPGLSNTLDADLTVTRDYRSVLSEVVLSRFGASPAAVFPGLVREDVGAMTGV
jgi:uncharacterized protein (DUF1501 family)